MEPLCARGFSRGFAARAVGLRPPKRSEEFSSAAREKKPLVPRVTSGGFRLKLLSTISMQIFYKVLTSGWLSLKRGTGNRGTGNGERGIFKMGNL